MSSDQHLYLVTKYFHHTKRKPQSHKVVISSFLLPPVLSNQSAFCLYVCAYCGYFIKIEPFNICTFASGIFYSVLYL